MASTLGFGFDEVDRLPDGITGRRETTRLRKLRSEKAHRGGA